MKIFVHNLVADSHPPIKSGNGYQLDDERKTDHDVHDKWLAFTISIHLKVSQSARVVIFNMEGHFFWELIFFFFGN